MKPLILSLHDQHPMLKPLAKKLAFEIGNITLHNFPDGETYIKFENPLENRELIILNSLNKVNQKILPLIFAVETARQLGAKKIGLCSPYLGYMRQDKRFHPGEGITSIYFAKLLSRYFDWLVTVDPHLHRLHNLNEIYAIPTNVLHAASYVATWIINNITKPVLIGPDRESEQWVSEIANKVNAPYLILEKIRRGDRQVEVTIPNIAAYTNHTPILVDDIISTGQTMIKTISHLKQFKIMPPVCIAIHAVFAGDAYNDLLHAGASKIVTCNTIPHPSNLIDLLDLIANGIQQQLIS